MEGSRGTAPATCHSDADMDTVGSKNSAGCCDTADRQSSASDTPATALLWLRTVTPQRLSGTWLVPCRGFLLFYLVTCGSLASSSSRSEDYDDGQWRAKSRQGCCDRAGRRCSAGLAAAAALSWPYTGVIVALSGAWLAQGLLLLALPVVSCFLRLLSVLRPLAPGYLTASCGDLVSPSCPLENGPGHGGEPE